MRLSHCIYSIAMLLKAFAVMPHVENINIPLKCKYQLPKYHQPVDKTKFSLFFTTNTEH